MSATGLVRCEGLAKTFRMHVRGGATLGAFRDVSFTLDRGEFLGVAGPSGAGKSTLLRCVYRTCIPTAGRIWYTDAGRRVHDLATADEHDVLGLRRGEIGYVSQFFSVIPRVSALDTVVDDMVARGAARAEGEQRARELLERLRIPRHLWDMYPSTFSGGEKQRINIIRAISMKPRLLLLDEPTASLDAATALEAVALFREMKTQGTAMIGVFHDRALLKSLSDGILEMRP
ncbi:MAG TPA: ATP-binding cassette domain-containing protein [Spirochaetia bacterium]